MLWDYRTPGIPDELFIRDENVPITKEEVRAIAVSKARLKEGFTVIDVGSGSGSITVEAALQVGKNGKVYAIDKDANAVMLTQENVKRFDLSNVEVIHGDAIDVMNSIPDGFADAIFIGGSGGYMYDIVRLAYNKLKSRGRMVIDTIVIESMYEALRALNGLEPSYIEVTQVMVSKGRKVSMGTMLTARNPVLIIVACK
jgi:cobalt-precorrin-6B (C15)-methyltransferase